VNHIEEQSYELYLGDSYQIIKNIATSSVDLILTDPPYNVAKYSTGNIKLAGRKEINNDIAEWDLAEFNPHDWIEEFKRILKPTGNIFAFCGQNQFGKWHETFDPEFDTFTFMIWHKTNPTPRVRRNSFLNSCEIIVCIWNKRHKWNFTTQKEMHNFIEAPICMGSERVKNPHHPTQKPLRVLEHIIRIATDEGDTVFDPFMGVGSTGVAAVKLKRKFVGIEIDPAYFHAAHERIKKVEEEQKRKML